MLSVRLTGAVIERNVVFSITFDTSTKRSNLIGLKILARVSMKIKRFSVGIPNYLSYSVIEKLSDSREL